jgi:hypothetical protein
MIKYCHIKVDYLQKPLKQNLGLNYNILNIIRIFGGARKVTYKIECDQNFYSILYVWDNSMNYFNKETKDNIVFESNGADLFELNNKLLIQNGIATPRIYYIDRSKKDYLFDFEQVEYISGGEIEKYFGADEDIQYSSKFHEGVFNNRIILIQKIQELYNNYKNAR